MEVGRSTRFLRDSNGYYHIFGATQHNGTTIDTVQSLGLLRSLPRRRRTGTAWKSIVPQGSRETPTDSTTYLEPPMSGGSENVSESAGISQKPRRTFDFQAVPVLRRRGRLLRGRSDWTVSIVGPSCRVAPKMC